MLKRDSLIRTASEHAADRVVARTMGNDKTITFTREDFAAVLAQTFELGVRMGLQVVREPS